MCMYIIHMIHTHLLRLEPGTFIVRPVKQIYLPSNYISKLLFMLLCTSPQLLTQTSVQTTEMPFPLLSIFLYPTHSSGLHSNPAPFLKPTVPV